MRLPMMVFLAAALVVSARGQADTSVCNPGSYVGREDPKNPVPALPKTFYAAVEANMIDKGNTVDTYELVDEASDIVKVREVAYLQGVGTAEFTEQFDFANNQVVITTKINNSTVSCTVGDTYSFGDRYLFGEQVQTDNSGKQIFTSQGAWFLSSKFPAIYKGQTSVRGIPADWWENCIYLDSSRTTVKANWYFSASSWSTAANTAKVPLRLTIDGTTFDVGIGQMRKLTHSYEFAHFRTTLPDAEFLKIVELPPTAVCQGLKSARKMPTVPASFSFTAELVLPLFNRITSIREMYDSKLMLGRYDFIPDLTTDEVSEVHDWTTGIAYTTSRVYGNCTAGPIQAGTLDAADAGNGKVRMRTSREFFGVSDSEFQYSGRRLIRGIPCDVFNALRNTSEGGGLLWEVGFTADSVQVTGGPVNLQQNEPAYIAVRAPDDGQLLQLYNIIDFDESEPDLDRFHIGQCYTKAQKTRMSFRLEGNYETIVLKNKNLFRYMTLLSLVAYTAASPLRFSELTILNVKNPNHIGVTFMFLDPPPLDLSNLCDDCPRRKAIIPTEDAIALLRDAIENEKLVIEADVDNVNNLLALKAIKGSFVVGEDVRQEVQQNISLDTGAAAGVAIAFFVVGVVAALLTLALLVKFRGANLPPVIKGFVPQTYGDSK